MLLFAPVVMVFVILGVVNVVNVPPGGDYSNFILGPEGEVTGFRACAIAASPVTGTERVDLLQQLRRGDVRFGRLSRKGRYLHPWGCDFGTQGFFDGNDEFRGR